MTKDFYEIIKSQIDQLDYQGDFKFAGKVLQVMDGIAYVYGVQAGKAGGKVRFEAKDTYGIILNIEQHVAGVVIIGEESSVNQGDGVYVTNEPFTVGVGPEMVGRVVNVLGEPIDGLGPIHTKEKYAIERPAPAIMDRKSVEEPLMTGITALDAIVPIGKGQRELIIGDRQIGKTSIAIDAIINQKAEHDKKSKDAVYCVYVAIGQKASTVARLRKKLQDTGALDYTVIVLASASDIVAYQYFAPYVGCSIAEWFRDNGKHALVIYDDLTKHAVAYREISLLLRRAPGREAFPADVFYLHSRLLERAAKLSDEKGGGSLTALPIIETQAGDISAYIPTNVISITDGQIFLQQSLFHKGVKPAIDIGLSVSRIGGAAQYSAIKKAVGSMKADIAQYREMQAFIQFGAELDEETKKVLNRGDKLTYILLQKESSPRSLYTQTVMLYLANKGFLDNIENKHIDSFLEKYFDYLNIHHLSVKHSIQNDKILNDETKKILESVVNKIGL